MYAGILLKANIFHFDFAHVVKYFQKGSFGSNSNLVGVNFQGKFESHCVKDGGFDTISVI